LYCGGGQRDISSDSGYPVMGFPPLSTVSSVSRWNTYDISSDSGYTVMGFPPLSTVSSVSRWNTYDISSDSGYPVMGFPAFIHSLFRFPLEHLRYSATFPNNFQFIIHKFSPQKTPSSWRYLMILFAIFFFCVCFIAGLNILEHCVPSVSITMYMCRHTHRMT
jgi:hypothetical protein